MEGNNEKSVRFTWCIGPATFSVCADSLTKAIAAFVCEQANLLSLLKSIDPNSISNPYGRESAENLLYSVSRKLNIIEKVLKSEGKQCFSDVLSSTQYECETVTHLSYGSRTPVITE